MVGSGFALLYGTWLITIGIGSICVLAYYSAKHGYQRRRLQIPILAVIMLHYAASAYLQNAGSAEVYFSRPNYFDLSIFIMHISLAVAIFFICGLWSDQLKKNNELNLQQALQTAGLEKEASIAEERLKWEREINNLKGILTQKEKELAASNAELERFAYIASHDLQEPLRMVTGFLGQINKKYGDLFDDKGKQYMYFATDGATRMRQIILDLLDYSRVGLTTDKREEVDLNTLVLEITGLFKKQVNERGVRIKIDQLPVLNTFKAPVRQLFQILIANALKHQSADGASIISISAEEKSGHWKFTVADNGIGIDPAYLEQIFLPYKRLHSREQYPGTGIGLAITKKIVENLGGKITVESIEGKGTVFYFTLS
jgi:signal transduction histidine kinase